MGQSFGLSYGHSLRFLNLLLFASLVQFSRSQGLVGKCEGRILLYFFANFLAVDILILIENILFRFSADKICAVSPDLFELHIWFW